MIELISLEFWPTKSFRKRMSCISNKDEGFRRKCLRPDTTFSKLHQTREISEQTYLLSLRDVFKLPLALYLAIRLSLHKRFFHCNSYPMEILFCYHPSCGEVTMTACTWHNSYTVGAYATWCSDMIPYNGVTQNPVFHRISISTENLSVKWSSENYRDNHFWVKRMKQKWKYTRNENSSCWFSLIVVTNYLYWRHGGALL